MTIDMYNTYVKKTRVTVIITDRWTAGMFQGKTGTRH